MDAQGVAIPCRNCLPPALPGEAESGTILLAYLAKTGKSRAGAAQASARLEVCADCEKCLGGHTCMACGCLLSVKANVVESNCPHPEGDRWARRVQERNIR